ncbi:hypothetical protein FNO25_002957 [Vibrio fluvialis]|uniref:hypothetical protein n=1 Tax=Vibrio TaxID=662 RepID=UPI00155878D8|nr:MULTISPECIES: hypothetical protein [Vibrio]EKB3555044.1 hypothetical protein [Vibrio parahaemolyticus]EKO3405933.1 hypothetical protein [Vibrio fluvialis]EKO3953691.1 hypothetical protein [Vibrio fluvialis]EKO3974962.1 hypothetical protein [Vibrio fluvialis]EKO4001414.1 hypothetical protein [Vibrio fluvialis]
MTTQAKFVRDGSQVVNVATATTLTCNDKFILLLDKTGKKILYREGEGIAALFSDFKKVVKPDEKYGLVLDDGGFIDLRSVSTVFTSPKTGNLVVLSHDERALYVFPKSTYKDIDGLSESLLDVLVNVGPKKKIAKIDWDAYKG